MKVTVTAAGDDQPHTRVRASVYPERGGFSLRMRIDGRHDIDPARLSAALQAGLFACVDRDCQEHVHLRAYRAGLVSDLNESGFNADLYPSNSSGASEARLGGVWVAFGWLLEELQIPCRGTAARLPPCGGRPSRSPPPTIAVFPGCSA